MKKLLGILVLGFILSGCVTPEETYSTLRPHNALAKASDGTFGMSELQKDIEYAVFGALATCDHYGTGCALLMINGSKVTSKEAIDWRDNYNRNKKYLIISPGYRGSFIIASDTGERDEKQKKIPKKLKKKKTEPNSTEPSPDDQNKEEGFDKLLKNYFGDRKLHSIEGLWGYRRDEEKEARIYLIFKSEDDDYLFKELVIYHPIRKFEKKISTKVIKKINEKSYKVKRTWSNKGTIFERDGIVTIVNKFKLKFKSDRYCYSNEEECLKEDTVYKTKIWPPKVYTDEVDLTDEQSGKLKDLLD